MSLGQQERFPLSKAGDEIDRECPRFRLPILIQQVHLASKKKKHFGKLFEYFFRATPTSFAAQKVPSIC